MQAFEEAAYPPQTTGTVESSPADLEAWSRELNHTDHVGEFGHHGAGLGDTALDLSSGSFGSFHGYDDHATFTSDVALSEGSSSAAHSTHSTHSTCHAAMEPMSMSSMLAAVAPMAPLPEPPIRNAVLDTFRRQHEAIAKACMEAGGLAEQVYRDQTHLLAFAQDKVDENERLIKEIKEMSALRASMVSREQMDPNTSSRQHSSWAGDRKQAAQQPICIPEMKRRTKSRGRIPAGKAPRPVGSYKMRVRTDLREKIMNRFTDDASPVDENADTAMVEERWDEQDTRVDEPVEVVKSRVRLVLALQFEF